MTKEEALEIIKKALLYDNTTWAYAKELHEAIDVVEQELKTGYCRDCKWWKDSDGVYRRDCYTESQCPINRKEVFEGNGYCYMFEPRESEG